MKKFNILRWIKWILIYSGIWLGVIILFAAQFQLTEQPDWNRAFMQSWRRWIPWVLITPLILWLTFRFSLTLPKSRLRNGFIHVVASIFITMAALLSYEMVFRELRPGPPSPRPRVISESVRPPRDRIPPLNSQDIAESGEPSIEQASAPERNRPPRRPPPRSSIPRPVVETLRRFPNGYPVYWAIVGFQSMLIFGRQLRKRERQALELQTRLTQAQLDTLKLQLQPHFLFNALNAVSTLLHRDSDKADEMIGHISTLLRAVLDERNADEVPLKRELDLLRAYIRIEQVRFGDRIQFEQRVTEDCMHAKLPTLLLQPLIENAVRHGIEPLGKPGHIWLTVEKRAQELQILIEDDGVGRDGSNQRGWGIGLNNAEARLEALYGSDGYQLQLSDRQPKGTSLAIVLPYHRDEL